jgi:hypothetical protein
MISGDAERHAELAGTGAEFVLFVAVRRFA